MNKMNKTDVLGPLAAQMAMTGVVAATPQPDEPPVVSSRLTNLLTRLDKLLDEKYAFDVFAPNSINFGIMITYRQRWEPGPYQVGELVSTIPLAPKEIRRFTSRTVSKKTRNVKELEDALDTRKTESSDTARIDAQIVDKAQNKSGFKLTAEESFGSDDDFKITSTQTATQDQAKESEKSKKEFRESVLKSAQEYRRQHRTEIDTTESTEREETTFHEIENPNDELTVTYLFYELQRQYLISEKLQALTPVIFVANDVPRPDEVDDAWLIEHDWILRRVILDDSFRPALQYLTESFVGAEVNIRILEDNALAQKQVVDNINQQIRAQTVLLAKDQADLLASVRGLAAGQQEEGMLNTVKRIFDPLGITGQADTGQVSAAQAMVDYAKETRDRAERERARLMSELDVAVTALQAAVDKLSAAVKEHYNKVAGVDRLRLHVKDNILYYMQAIWSHEPPDQRFFRIYNLDVPDIVGQTTDVTIDLTPARSKIKDGFDQRSGSLHGTLELTNVTVTPRKLVDIADLDTVLGYKGNYAIYALKQNNFLTLNMMQDYLDVGDEVALRDPDEFANYTLDEVEELATCVARTDSNLFQQYRDEFKQLVIDRLSGPRNESDPVIVPTPGLYIEALVGTHPLLEDFKLIHRALDVNKVQAEIRHGELENIRLAARALRGQDEDPDIEKKIVVETTGAAKDVVIGADGN